MAVSTLDAPPLLTGEQDLLQREIAIRAYHNWRLDGETCGRDVEHWLEAETDVTALLALCRRVMDSAQQEQNDQLLQSVLDEAPAVISLQDAAGRYLFVNRLFETAYGVSRESVVGRRDADFVPLEAAAENELRPSSSGEAETQHAVEQRIPHRDGVHTYLSVKFTVSGGNGSPKTVCSISTDITERKEFERRLNLLHGISSVLATSASLKDIARPVLEKICSIYEWDAGAVWEVDSSGKFLQCLTTWSQRDDDLQEFCHRSTQLRFERGVGLPGTVWKERQGVWVSDFEDQPGLVRRALALQSRLITAYGCPLQVREQFVGAMEFYSRSNRRPAAGFLETMASIGTQLGQFAARRCAERSLLLRNQQRALAKRIQQGWHLRESLQVPGYDIAGASMPADDVGGDYFDIFSMSGGRTGIAIGDAAGHGLDSALLIAEVRAYIRALAATESSLERVFSLTNQYFIQHAEEGTFVTLLLVRLDPATGEMTYNNAGHLSGQVFDSAGRRRTTMPSTGFPLGVISGVPFPPGPKLRLRPGDWALLFTDGVLDACKQDGEPLGIGRFLEIVHDVCPGRCARETVQTVLDRVADFAGHEFQDDMTAVLIVRDAA